MVWIRALQPRWKSLLAQVLRPFLKAIDLSLVHHSDRILANSSFTAGEIERVYGLTPDGVAYPGIDFASYSAGETHKNLAMITVARLSKFKRVDFLLEVFKGLLEVHPDLTYHIVGTGEEEHALREQARRLGIETQTVFHGLVTETDLLRLNQRALLFLHGSIDEPFGMAPLEAIACGTPVVAHHSGGPVEFVTAECGRLIESRDLADWVREITNYLDVLRAGHSDSAVVRRCAQRFDWSYSLRPAVTAIAGVCASFCCSSCNPPAQNQAKCRSGVS
jgi:glycosyltransferase involved in cell wall biosynthesis